MVFTHVPSPVVHFSFYWPAGLSLSGGREPDENRVAQQMFVLDTSNASRQRSGLFSSRVSISFKTDRSFSSCVTHESHSHTYTG